MDNLIRPKALAKKLGIGLSTLYDRMKKPDFPPKVQISDNVVGFSEKKINEWIEKNTEKKEEITV